jgi:hypothetical protein
MILSELDSSCTEFYVLFIRVMFYIYLIVKLWVLFHKDTHILCTVSISKSITINLYNLWHFPSDVGGSRNAVNPAAKSFFHSKQEIEMPDRC